MEKKNNAVPVSQRGESYRNINVQFHYMLSLEKSFERWLLYNKMLEFFVENELISLILQSVKSDDW